MLAVSDAAWGVGSNHLVKGCSFAHKKVLEGVPDLPYVILDWRSLKLHCASRSSLNAEAQSGSAAVDLLEFILVTRQISTSNRCWTTTEVQTISFPAPPSLMQRHCMMPSRPKFRR